MVQLYSSHDLCGLTDILLLQENFKFALAGTKSHLRIELYKLDDRH